MPSNRMRIAGIVGALFAALGGLIACIVLVPTLAGMEGARRLRWGLDFEGGLELVYRIDAPASANVDGDAVRETLARRLEPFDDVSVTLRGRDVVVEMAALEDHERLRGAIGRSTTLELRAVDDAFDLGSRLPPLPEGVRIASETIGPQSARYLVARAREPLETIAREIDLGDRDLLLGRYESDWRTYVVEREVAVGGSMIETVEAEIDPHSGRPLLGVVFDDEGSRALADLSERNVGRRIAIVIDGEVSMAPVVHEPIRGGRASITLGSGTFEKMAREASELAAALRAGSLPHPLVLERESVVAPAYDARSVRLAFLAGVIVMLVLGVAGVIRYRRRAPGLLLAVLVALSALAVLALFEATVTLPLVLALVSLFAVSLASSIALLERARRHLGASIVPMVLMGLAPLAVLLAAGLVLYQTGHGPWRSVAIAFVVGSLAGIPSTGAWILAIAGLTSERGRLKEHTEVV